MSEAVPKKAKTPPAESDLSQILAHGPAYRDAYGRPLGALLMMLAIGKVSKGPVGIAAAASVVMTVFYNYFFEVTAHVHQISTAQAFRQRSDHRRN